MSAFALEAALLVGLTQPLEQRRAHDRQPYRRVDEDLAELSALGWRHELTPRNRFTIRRAGETSPKNRLRANTHAVVVAFELDVLAGAAHAQLAVWSELLSPVAGHAAADGEDP